ncbi:hypothetical protein [Dokdonia sp. PRO95]|uniref:hypothetical protein n=1 Tax=Dokdonia sp. PRO95 TaxID=1239415 RepID=UPI00055284FC|nr:hypothetical protein [Dokdonia sp. PRO95]
MKLPSTKEIFQRKFNTLSKIEENFVNSHFSKNSNFNIERLLYSCDDGFVILRRYSLEDINNFEVRDIQKNVVDFLKELPYPTKSNKKDQINLFELLRKTIGLELRIGQTINLGSSGGGIKIGDEFEIDGFVILTRKYSDLEDIQETLVDIFKFLEINSEKDKLNKKVKQLLFEIEDRDFLIEYKDLEIQERELELERGKKNIQLLSQFNPNERNEEIIYPNIKKPFYFCVLGEVSDQAIIRKELTHFFEKIGLGINEWNVDFYNNSKLEKTNILKSLIIGQSKYEMIITGQIFHHSGKGNSRANIISELKNDKYISHKIGSTPKDKLTPDKLLHSLDLYLKELI